ncbi:MAG: hypothetical protein MJ094_09235 [Saccharofermentans sp.]|nr:hypothetical protein [Saccharofermentans sp.]
MVDPWGGLANFLAEMIEKYGNEIEIKNNNQYQYMWFSFLTHKEILQSYFNNLTKRSA